MTLMYRTEYIESIMINGIISIHHGTHPYEVPKPAYQHMYNWLYT